MKYLGHTTKEAEYLLKKHGENNLYESKEYPFLKSIFSSLKERGMVILLLASVTYYFFGKFTDFLIIAIFACVTLSLKTFQNFKIENSSQELKKLTQKFAEVYRDGEKSLMLTSKIVPGDIIILNEGERVPADVVILESSNLTIDESVFNSEDILLQKKATSSTKSKKLESDSLAYSGTIITSGWLIGSVFETGKDTKIGKMKLFSPNLVSNKPVNKNEVNSINSKLVVIGILTCSFIFGFGYFYTGDFAKSLLNAVTLLIAFAPMELPIVLAIFISLSSLKLSKKGTIIKNKSIIETLGEVNVLCVDKTETITKNKMKLAKIITLNEEIEGDSKNWNTEAVEIIKISLLAKYFNSKDSIDKEIENVAEKLNLDLDDYKFVSEKVLDQKFVFSRMYTNSGDPFIFVKGAFEEIIKLCKITSKRETFIYDKFYELTNQGFRVVGVAYSDNKNIKSKFNFRGLLVFEDEIRLEVPNIIKLCQDNSIRICMITEDDKNTAITIAKKISMNNPENVITGDEIMNLPNYLLDEKIRKTNVYARILPEQKLRILNLLKSSGNIVAITGDTVNDALALKSANIGILIEGNVSRTDGETFDMTVRENNLKNIVDSIIESRRIYDNLACTFRYIYSSHLPLILIVILNIFLKLPELLLPIQVILLKFIIDPFSTLVFESIPVQKGRLNLKPRKGKFKILKNMNIAKGSVYGFLIFVMVFVTYYLYVIENVSAAQTISLFLILGLNIILIYLNYSENLSFGELMKNKVYVISNSILLLGIILIYNFRELLNLSEKNYNLLPYDYGVIFGLMIGYFVLGKIAQKLI